MVVRIGEIMAINRLQYSRILEQQLAKGKGLEPAHKTAIKRGEQITKAIRDQKKRKVRTKTIVEGLKKLKRKSGFKSLTQTQKEGWRRRRKHRSSINE
jgi:hypothetical protein